MKNLLALAITTSLVACGGGGSKTPDAHIGPFPDGSGSGSDASNAACGMTTATTLDVQDILVPSDGMAAVWGGTVTTDLGGGMPAAYQFEFYDTGSFDFTQPADLTAGDQANYKTCEECVRVITQDSMGNPRYFFQSGGTMTLSSNPVTGNTMMGTITGLSLDEVMIADDFTSTPVAGGTCLTVGDITLNHDSVPNAYTCDHATFADGTNCNCMCGQVDPDCATATNAVVGCTANQVCPDDACHDKATNDTCALATTLTIGTPANGTSFGAASNYDSGMTGCTGFAEPGPDVAFKVALTAGTTYTFALTNVTPTTYDPSISVVGPSATACTATLTCLAGADMGVGGDPETFTYQPTTTGNYFIIVDTFDDASAGGTFTIEVTQ